MSGDRRGGRTSGNGDNPGSSRETVDRKKNPWQAAGRGQRAQLSSSSNAPPTTARQAWNGNGSSRPWGNNRAQPSDHRPAARGNPRSTPQTTELQALNVVVTPPLANGWQWASRPRPSDPESSKDDASSSGFNPETDSEGDDISDDESDDDESDEYDSDASAKSFGTRKMNKWFKSFFEDLDNLSVEQIHEQPRHCPACKNGPGAIDWFKGLQSLVTHARTKGSKRVKLHRELAALLEEEMSRRGTSVVPSGEQFGKWKGLHKSTESTDWEIVWPPMWLGMGNQELLDYFSEYAATKARHAYGPTGHRGMSVLIFESSAVGYTEANRLHAQFIRQNTDREAWQRCKVLFLPGGKRQLYGFLAKKEDMETFNRHCKGKQRLKYEMRSHNEMVVIQMKQMSEDNQQLNYLKNKVVKKEQHSKAVTETACSLAQKLRETEEDNRLIRREAKEKHLEHTEEMTSLEKFIEDHRENIYKAMELMGFVKLLQEERANARQCDVDSGSIENCRLTEEQVQRFKDCQVTDSEEFEAERDKLIKAHKEKKIQLEKELDTALSRLMEKHKPGNLPGLQLVNKSLRCSSCIAACEDAKTPEVCTCMIR